MKYVPGAAAIWLAVSSSAHAQTANVATIAADAPIATSDRIHGIVALGGAFTPKYDGASSYQAGPFAMFGLQYRGVELKLLGTSLLVNLGGDTKFEFGPSLGYSDGRRRKDMDGQFRLLDRITGAAELGGYAGYHLGGNDKGPGDIFISIQASKTMKSGRGFAVQPSIRYTAIRSKKLLVNLSIGATINDAKAMQTRFGITPTEAQRSGLVTYKPKGGIAEASTGITTSYQLSRHWGLIGLVRGSTYLSDAADSPIVKDGSKTFGIAALGVSYSF